MNKTVKITAVAGFALMAAQAASAGTITFDFEGLAANTPLTEITVGTSVFSVASSVNFANIFDTTDPTTSDHVGDNDILPAVQGENGVAGNVLIIQENGSNPLANDRAGGGVITFTLSSGPSLALVGASGIDDDTWDFSTSFSGSLGTLALTEENETGAVTFSPFFLSIGDSFAINYQGSGAVDSLVFAEVAPIPVPAALPLLLAGIGGLGYMKRRQKKAAKA